MATSANWKGHDEYQKSLARLIRDLQAQKWIAPRSGILTSGDNGWIFPFDQEART
jgi:hypothetical protein